jgi:ATP-dependent protease ClpP protease subunit
MTRLPIFNYKISNDASNSTCDIYIDGAIVDAQTEQIYRDWWNDDTNMSFKKLRDQINGSKTVNVYVNSGGGQVVEAMAIHDYLKNLQANGIVVNTYGRGLIASAATYILMASNNSTISENSFFMIHEVSGMAYGTATEVENQAATLRKFNTAVVDFYTNTTGLSATVIGNMMNKETWMTGKEAMDKGFVKNIETEQTFTNEISKENWLFNNTEVLQAYNSFTNKSSNEMDIKKLVMDALKEAGFIKNETDTTNYGGIATAIENALKPFNEELDTKVTNAVTEATKDLGTTVTNAVAEALKNVATPEAITAAVENAIEPINKELQQVKDSMANTKGGEANPKGTQADSPFNHEGSSWK